MSCDYNCEYNCEECDVPDMVMEFVKGYNQAIEDVMKIYNEMQPQLATHVYEFGERIKVLKK